MIAKHVQSRRGNYRRLVSYLLNPQDKHERVGKVAVAHCQSEDPDMAVLEVLNTQAQNVRTGDSKTYHLLISFRAGEHPDDGVLRAIEERLCAGLGYDGHQRVSVVHHDTDNLHIHVAINKIHPTRRTIHTPFRDYRTLGRLCAQLEREFGLARDNHRAKKHGGEDAAADMERHAGVESLLGWIRRTCREELCAARSWDELRRVLAANGLALRERGNGFILVDAQGIALKASTVDRQLSKAALEARLGPLAGPPRTEEGGTPVRSYGRVPVNVGVDTGALYAAYQAEQAQAAALRGSERERLQEQRRRQIEGAKRQAALKRTAIRALHCDRLTKRILYACVSRSLLSEIKNIGAHNANERRAAANRCRRRTWVDWLRARAELGDAAAVTVLRGRRGNSPVAGNALYGQGGATTAPLADFDGVTRKGTVIYRHGATVLRDGGDRLEVSESFDAEGLRKALELAVARYGACIRVQGSAAFQRQIARAAADMPLRFDDAALERRRRQYSNTGAKGGSHEEHRQRTGPITSGGIPADGTGIAAGRRRGTGLGGVGAEPPPAARNHLRTMSELGLVRLTGGGEVLLPGDVRGDLEQQGAAATDGLRRGAAALTAADQAASAAAAKYVFDREQTRRGISGISKHRTYDGFEGAASYAGTRKVDGIVLSLLKVGQEVLVKPVDPATANRLKRLAVGAPLTVAAGGVIRTKGRSR